MKTSLSAQASTIEHFARLASRANLKRGGFASRDSEGDLLRERLLAAIATLRWLERHEVKIRAAVGEGL